MGTAFGAMASPLTAAELRATLRLPKTSFPMRANAAQREPVAVPRLTTQLYRRQWNVRRGSGVKPFVLHDGPPYANGPLHIGHALNKVLKDVINRYKLLRGQPVLFVPGWDCHGLPIELKALESLAKESAPAADKGTNKKKKKEEVSAEAVLQRSDLSPLQVRAAARAWAEAAMRGQRDGFVRWGVMADWSDDNSGVYMTMDPKYEAAQLGEWRPRPDRVVRASPRLHPSHRCVPSDARRGTHLPQREARVLVAVLPHCPCRGGAGVQGVAVVWRLSRLCCHSRPLCPAARRW